MLRTKVFATLLVALFSISSLSAQYFGRNKARYERFDFSVLETPHYDLYHYLENPERLEEFASWVEHWHRQHQSILRDTFTQRNPLILYNDHADFQQTNAIQGAIGVGTGGVTEAFKNRVIMPMAMSRQQSHHVLGHELVHAYQYHLILQSDSTGLQNLANLPLWMVEGMAEYMSIGREDAHTSMWMRDAILNDDVPTIRELNNPKYFPYRYGQAFWAFVTGIYGDDIIEPYFVATAKYGLEIATQRVLGVPLEKLSELWVDGIKRHYGPYVDGQKEKPVGRTLVDAENGGRLNIAPVVSPNGRYLIFLSEKNLFSTDLFLADARSGEIIRQVASSNRNGHIDDFDYIESAGTWSPDSKQFAFVGVSKGRNILIIKDVQSGKTVKELVLEEVPAFKNPTWSPDGKYLVIAGLVQGQVDLYQVRVSSGKVTQLTNDAYSEMLPNWSLDGTRLVFATDQFSSERGRKNGNWTFDLAEMDVVSRIVQELPTFQGADNLNPQYDLDGNILFVSDRNGYRNLYKYETLSGQVTQLTELLTGVSGITPFAPAISATRSAKRNRVVYTHFYNGAYTVHLAKPEDFANTPVAKDQIDFAAGTLPRFNKRASSEVEAGILGFNQAVPIGRDSLRSKEYRPKFRMDYAGGGAGVGVGAGAFGLNQGAAGGVDLLFSDILGDNQLYSSLFLNGDIQDFGGTLAYVNRKNRIAWGASFSHVPFRTGQYGFIDTVSLRTNTGESVLTAQYALDLTRIFEDRVGVFAQLPFSQTLRLEGGAAYSLYYSRTTRYSDYFLTDGQTVFNSLVFQDRQRLDPDEVFGVPVFQGQVASVNVALVGDNSFFGFASPLQGQRYRIGVERSFNGFGTSQNLGDFNFWTLTADYRKYFRLKPVTLAVRAMHTGRYGPGANSLFPNYLGQPWFIRGYEFNAANQILSDNGRSINDLLGSKLLVSNIELRIPFTGPKQLALISSKFLLTELSFFVDGGLAWDSFAELTPTDGGSGIGSWATQPVFSAGASMRVNLFGSLIVEPYYAFPLQQNTRGVFGLNFIPGW